eukprot:2697692-Amphidinium_carterae.1
MPLPPAGHIPPPCKRSTQMCLGRYHDSISCHSHPFWTVTSAKEPWKLFSYDIAWTIHVPIGGGRYLLGRISQDTHVDFRPMSYSSRHPYKQKSTHRQQCCYQCCCPSRCWHHQHRVPSLGGQ